MAFLHCPSRNGPGERVKVLFLHGFSAFVPPFPPFLGVSYTSQAPKGALSVFPLLFLLRGSGRNGVLKHQDCRRFTVPLGRNAGWNAGRNGRRFAPSLGVLLPPNPPSFFVKKSRSGPSPDLLTTNQHPLACNSLTKPYNSAAAAQERRRKGRWNIKECAMEHNMNNATARPAPGGGLWPLPPLATSPRSYPARTRGRSA
jgi:hypothetical protein